MKTTDTKKESLHYMTDILDDLAESIEIKRLRSKSLNDIGRKIQEDIDDHSTY